MRSQVDWKALRKYSVHASVFLAFIYLVGIIGFFLPVTKPVFMRLVPVNLLFSLAFLVLFNRPFTRKLFLMVVLVAVTSFLVEFAGVKTGLLFGSYEYGSALGWKLFDVPVIIGINWAMLVYMTYSVFFTVRMHWLLKSFSAASLMLAYDVMMEPVACMLDFWHWNHQGIPSLNYFTWFGLAFMFHIVFHLARVRFVNKIAGRLFFIQFVFFVILNIIL